MEPAEDDPRARLPRTLRSAWQASTRWERSLLLLSLLALGCSGLRGPLLRADPDYAVEFALRRSLPLDPWAQPWRQLPVYGPDYPGGVAYQTYSSGPDGRDEGGAGDDVLSMFRGGSFRGLSMKVMAIPSLGWQAFALAGLWVALLPRACFGPSKPLSLELLRAAFATAPPAALGAALLASSALGAAVWIGAAAPLGASFALGGALWLLLSLVFLGARLRARPPRAPEPPGERLAYLAARVAARAQGSDAARDELLRLRRSEGLVSEDQLWLAAYLGDAASRRVVEDPPPPALSVDAPRDLVRLLSQAGWSATLRASLALSLLLSADESLNSARRAIALRLEGITPPAEGDYAPGTLAFALALAAADPRPGPARGALAAALEFAREALSEADLLEVIAAAVLPWCLGEGADPEGADPGELPE